MFGVNFEYLVILSISKKVSEKLHALSRVTKYLGSSKARLVMKSYTTLHFSNCPFSIDVPQQKHGKLNRIHERALSLVYDN